MAPALRRKQFIHHLERPNGWDMRGGVHELVQDSNGIPIRRQAGKMLFYSFNSRDPLARTYKIFVSVSMLRPLILKLR